MNSQHPKDNPDNLLERSLAAMRNAPIPDGPSQELLADTLAALQKLNLSNAVKTAQGMSGEEHVIEVLRGYASFNNGKFPEKINVDWGVFAGMIRNKATKAVGDGPGLDDKQLQLMTHVGALLPFLMSIPKEDWAYLGNGVTLGEKDKIVFWHRDPQTRTYRAVYGDLTAKEVAVEQLPARSQ